MLIVLCLILLVTVNIFLVYRQLKFKYLVFKLTKLYFKSLIKTHLLTMTDTRKVIWIWAKMGRIVNACTWLANLAIANKQYQIWCASYQLIASWYPYKEITWYKQSNMCLLLVCACLVLLDSYEFQSLCNLVRAGYFTILEYISCT